MRLLTLILFAGCFAYADSPRAVAPRKFQAPEQAKLQRALRHAMPSLRQKLPALQPYVLPPLETDKAQTVTRQSGGTRVGTHRALGAAMMRAARRDGQVWRLAVQSPDAGGVRLHFTGFDVGAGQVWIHDGSGAEDRVLGPYSGRGPNNDGDFWSETVSSSTASVEYQPDAQHSAQTEVPFAIPELSHRFAARAATAPRDESAASCELDVNCYADWASTALGVAKIDFEEGADSYACSGSLLNSRNNSHVPYFLTANHCLSDNATARTVEATWLYQKDRCNGSLPRSFPRSLGATLLATGDRTQGDFTLLKLSSVPDGVTFLGWDPSDKAVNTAVTVIHHPEADYKRIAFGKITPPNAAQPAFYPVLYSAGLTETGSSGSGIFSAPGVLVGTLSHGPTSETTEGYCRLMPFTDYYGKFSTYYPQLRDYLEDRVSTPPAGTTPPPATNPLTSGVPASFTMAPVPGGAIFNGSNGFSINVPQGATRLEITLRTTTPNADIDLFVRYGQDVTLDNGRAVADYSSAGPTGNEQVTITASSTPPLRAGTYYLAMGLFTPNTAVAATMTATVTTGSAPPPPPPPTGGGSGGANALTSGTPRTFILPPIADATFYSQASGFTIAVPQGASRLDIKLTSSTPGVDLDMYVRYGQDPALSGNSITADFASEGPAADESVTITPATTPPLRAGTYYIALGSFTKGIAISATITATVTTGTPPGSGSGNTLTSGVPAPFSVAPLSGGTLLNGEASYRIAVPQGATSLDIAIHAAPPDANVAFFVRYNQDVALDGGRVLADNGGRLSGGDAHLVIDPNNPLSPLHAGTYYISLAVFTTGVRITGTVTATVNGGGGTPPPPSGDGPVVLSSGVAQPVSIQAVSQPTIFFGPRGYAIDVPAGATRLDVKLTTATPGADLDLYVSYNRDNGIKDGQVDADYGSDGPDGNERITITPGSTPPLQPGRYYISVAAFTTNTNIDASLVATVDSGSGGPPSPDAPTLLIPGQPARFSLEAVDQPTLFNGSGGFKVQVPLSSPQMKIQVVSDDPSVDLDVYVRYQTDNVLDNNGHLVTDYASEGPTGNETMTITSSSTPPLRNGTYYISFGLFTQGKPATGSILVTVDGGILSRPSGDAEPLTPGIPAPYSLPAVATPTLFSGSSAYRISVEPGHTALRLHGDAQSSGVTMYVRRGKQPGVEDGRVAADFEAAAGEDIVIDGPALQPGVYYIALGQHAPDQPATGAVKATLTGGGGSHRPAAAVFGGMPVNPKPSAQVRQEIPQPKPAPAEQHNLVKRTNSLQKRHLMKLQQAR